MLIQLILSFSEGKERLLYLLLGLTLLLSSTLAVVTVWLLWQRKQFQAGATSSAASKVFAAEVCQVDTGMDLINITPTSVTIVAGPHHVYPPEEVSSRISSG